MILYRYNKIQLCVFFHKIFSYLRFLVLISGLATGTLRIGCFKDDTQRDLTGFSMTSELLTVELCVGTCRGRGFLFAGLEEGNQCFCGNSVGNYYIPVNRNTAILSSHRGCSKDKIRPTLVLRPSTILSLLLFRQFCSNFCEYFYQFIFE